MEVDEKKPKGMMMKTEDLKTAKVLLNKNTDMCLRFLYRRSAYCRTLVWSLIVLSFLLNIASYYLSITAHNNSVAVVAAAAGIAIFIVCVDDAVGCVAAVVVTAIVIAVATGAGVAYGIATGAGVAYGIATVAAFFIAVGVFCSKTRLVICKATIKNGGD